MMLLMEPTYTGCVVGGISASVNMNGCLYTFEPIKTIEADRYTGRMGVECPKEKRIEITVGKCLISIEGQINLETVEFVNNTNAEATKDTETWKTEIKKAKYMQTGTCSSGTGEFENLTYKGTETIKGENEETLAPIGLFVSD